MTRIGTIHRWEGREESYGYFVHGFDDDLRDVKGNYIDARLDGNEWVAVFVGQGVLSAATDLDAHPQAECIRAHGATHVHVHHFYELEGARRKEELDLIAAHNPPCNEGRPWLPIPWPEENGSHRHRSSAQIG